MSGHFIIYRTSGSEVMAKTGTGTATSEAENAVSVELMLEV
jgi:hypothetical protein